MTLVRLVRQNLAGNGFRSLAVFVCAALVSTLAVTASLVVRGAEASLRLNLQRLGADILVLPWGTMTEKIGGVRLMSAAIEGWMPGAYVARVAAVEGVAEVSPQLHLATLHDSPYCRLSELFLVAYEPTTDFTLRPWAEKGLVGGLREGEAVAGAEITIPEGDDELTLYGYPLRLVGRLAPTATTMDQTIFVSLGTAAQMVAGADARGQEVLNVQPGGISAVMVKVHLSSDPHEVAVRMLEKVPGVVPLETPDLFQTERRQMIGILRTVLGLLAVTWALAVVFMGMVFSITANERRCELGVLRALGFSRIFIIKALLMEGAALALAGSLAGVLATAVGLVTLGDQVAQVVGLPLQLPTPLGLISLSLGGQLAALASVTLAAFVPAWRISRQEVSMAMRE